MTIFQCLVYSQLSFDKPTHQSKGAAKLRNFIEMDNNFNQSVYVTFIGF